MELFSSFSNQLPSNFFPNPNIPSYGSIFALISKCFHIKAQLNDTKNSEPDKSISNNVANTDNLSPDNYGLYCTDYGFYYDIENDEFFL